ncbi:MAG: hypothetical protein ACRBCI_02205 [Cellvibrionaceae bacterium]
MAGDYCMSFEKMTRIIKSLENLPLSDEEAMIYATNRINIFEYSQKESSTLFGRIMSFFSRPNTTHIETSIHELKALCEIVDMDYRKFTSFTKESGEILVEFKSFKNLVNRAINNAKN